MTEREIQFKQETHYLEKLFQIVISLRKLLKSQKTQMQKFYLTGSLLRDELWIE